MYNPCIAIDVSKGKSHIQGFLDNNIKFTNAKPIKHNKEGFDKILKLINDIEKKTNITPIVLFEYTGIYHKTLEQFLKNNNIKYHPVPPLQAAKIRQTDIHSSKDDKRDCYTLSQVYYLNKLNVFYNPSQEEIDLRQLHKQYCMLEAHYQKIEVNFYEYLDTLYPNYHSLVSEVDSYSSLKFLYEFPHPHLILKHRHSTLVSKYEKLTNHSQYYSYNFINDLLKYVGSIVPGDTIDSISVSVFLFFFLMCSSRFSCKYQPSIARVYALSSCIVASDAPVSASLCAGNLKASLPESLLVLQILTISSFIASI